MSRRDPSSNRKTRRDKGKIYATDRDVEVLTWISEQYAWISCNGYWVALQGTALTRRIR